MRIDIITIFPDYFDVLDISLIGKARRDGVVDIRVTNLRDYAHDKHRTVDDTPFGGGPGMLMRPEPWGDALDDVFPPATATETSPVATPLFIVPSPAGTPLAQAQAVKWAAEEHIVIACGRYEGIDQRVVDEAANRFRVHEASVGDYVLNGGEAAALVMLEAMVRLLPGAIGNSESLDEESHVAGLLEGPAFTKPASWRSHAVPQVLLSGDHGAIARWRRQQSLMRTAERRPDLIRGLNPATLNAAEIDLLKQHGWTVSNGRFHSTQESVAD